MDHNYVYVGVVQKAQPVPVEEEIVEIGTNS